MFVQKNTVQAIKSYFNERLKPQFFENEIKLIVRECVCRRLGLSVSEYLVSETSLLSESDLLYFRSIVKRLQSNEPFQYIIGSTLFYDLELKTDNRALIPRPETEELVDWILLEYANASSLRILDLCTGSGCIALALKSKLIDSAVYAVDISNDAVNLATENSNKLNLHIELNVMDVLNPDLFKSYATNSFDCWVSNPPYVPLKDSSEMAANVILFEPSIALFVKDETPLQFYSAIAEEAMRYLKKQGRLYFEIHEQFGERLINLLTEIGFVNIELRKDLQGKDRMMMAQKP
ncbi:MAG: peptide chain release factor N(5)-glutamine methyltransferase [Flavobacteriia bacterium]|jgi:release factor glutamine methyltransferase